MTFDFEVRPLFSQFFDVEELVVSLLPEAADPPASLLVLALVLVLPSLPVAEPDVELEFEVESVLLLKAEFVS